MYLSSQMLLGMWCLAGLGACGRAGDVSAARAEVPISAARAEPLPPKVSAPPAHVDSMVPREVALRRFQQVSRRATALVGGATSRDELVERFVRAVEGGDTAALGRLVLSRGEFAYLYYPSSAQGRPPYELSPDLMWFMMVERSNRGVTALVAERAGRPLGFVSYHCVGDSTVEERNRLWGPCLIRRAQAPGDTVEERLFGPIVARDGRFKFVSYSNKL